MFEIESDVSIPPRRNNHLVGRGLKYPLDKMDVGDSFLVPVEPKANETTEQATSRLISNLNGAANRYRKTQDPGFAATVRAVEDGVRLWRVEPRPAKRKASSEPNEDQTELSL